MPRRRICWLQDELILDLTKPEEVEALIEAVDQQIQQAIVDNKISADAIVPTIQPAVIAVSGALQRPPA